MKLLDNINNTVRDDLEMQLRRGSKVSIAAAFFSIYAFKELKKQLERVDEFRFIFTSPTFLKEDNSKQSKEFYISRLNRERSIYGTEFEIKLRNKLTQRAIAKECADWIQKKATFKTNITQELMPGFMTVDESTYMPINGFSTVDLGCEKGNNVYYPVQRTEANENGQYYLKLFEDIWNDKKRLQDVTDIVVNSISAAYKENSPEFVYFLMLYNIFSEFLDDISEDVLPNEATGFKDSKIWNMLYKFQKDAALAIINKLEKYNGCILADSVGLGKTYTALSVIKYYENRNKSVLVLCPKKLVENWNTYRENYKNNPIAEDRMRYDVLFHTDLGRDTGESNGKDLSRLNWGNYDLVVIDESHNFRNGVGTHKNQVDNRYQRLMDRVIRAGVRTKVLMLSATPVNNRFVDLRNQLALAYEGDSRQFSEKLDVSKSVEEIFKQAQRAFTAWSKLLPEDRTTDKLLKSLDFDFFELLDSVTIARSRKHIEKYYGMDEIGTFPERLKPLSFNPKLTDLKSSINYSQINEQLLQLYLTIYTPSEYIFDSKLEKYEHLSQGEGLTQRGREEGIRKLMRVNLLKRLESSVYAFKLTLKRVRDLIKSTIDILDSYDGNSRVETFTDFSDDSDLDYDDQNTDFFVGRKVRIDLNDIDRLSWKQDLEHDVEILELLVLMVDDITPEHDMKLQELKHIIRNKINNPINEDNKKLLIFTAFSDTAEYLYDNISKYVKTEFGLNSAMVTGSVEGRTTVPKLRADLNTVLTVFSPISKDKHLLMENNTDSIDVLIATDCISEGQNLQDCDYLVNYDIHWNPVRIIQRFGRIDRIGSKNDVIQLVNFWPDMDLDEYIKLKSRVETRMKITVMTATGDDDLINEEEQGDLEYRRKQLKRLKEEVVDIEDMSDNISIMDLGLNEFRLDLLEYVKSNSEIEHAPHGLYAVVPSTDELPPGVIFILKNVNENVNINNKNRIHPFYMVYVDENSNVVCDYLEPKSLLDTVRLLCRGNSEPYVELCSAFNKETKDGSDMGKISGLLSDTIQSIIHVKEERDIDSLFQPGGTTALMSDIKGLDDFELIAFLVVR